MWGDRTQTKMAGRSAYGAPMPEYRDLIPDPENLPSRYRQERGVWKYPFAKVQQHRDDDGFRRWTIDLLAEPDTTLGDIRIEDIEPGDLVADDILRDTPYWEVDEVDHDLLRVYVRPIPPNPWETGVGAGGAPITEHDLRVHTGEFERDQVDAVLDRIREGRVHDYRDVAYILLGTVPVQMGPNGSQGGWYSPTDTWNNRGGQQGMTPEEIVIADAERLQQLGLPVPPGVLAGEVDPETWADLVKAGAGATRIPRDPGILFPGEDPDDPAALLRMIATHPLPWVKHRDYAALAEIANPFPRAEMDRLYETPGDTHEEQDRLRETWRRAQRPGAQPELLDEAARIIARLPVPDHALLDPYYLLREAVIEDVTRRRRPDLLVLFEDAFDPDNRRYVAYGYTELGMAASLVRMFQRETHPEALRAMLVGLAKLGVDPIALLAAHPEQQQVAIDVPGDVIGNYHRDQLRKEIAQLQRRQKPGSIAGRRYHLMTTNGVWSLIVERGTRAWKAVFGEPSFRELTSAVGLPVDRLPMVGPTVGAIGDILMQTLFVVPKVAERVGDETWIDPKVRRGCVQVAKYIDMVTPGPWGSGIVLLGFTAATLGYAPARAAVDSVSSGITWLLRRMRGQEGVLVQLHEPPEGPDDGPVGPAQLAATGDAMPTLPQRRLGDALAEWVTEQGDILYALSRFLVAHHVREEAGLPSQFEPTIELAEWAQPERAEWYERGGLRAVAGPVPRPRVRQVLVRPPEFQAPTLPEDPDWPAPQLYSMIGDNLERLPIRTAVMCAAVAGEMILPGLRALPMAETWNVGRRFLTDVWDWTADEGGPDNPRYLASTGEMQNRLRDAFEWILEAEDPDEGNGLDVRYGRYGRMVLRSISNMVWATEDADEGDAPDAQRALATALRQAAVAARLGARIGVLPHRWQQLPSRAVFAPFFREWWANCRAMLAFRDAPTADISGRR